jgi:hypothetical protein
LEGEERHLYYIVDEELEEELSSPFASRRKSRRRPQSESTSSD